MQTYFCYFNQDFPSPRRSLYKHTLYHHTRTIKAEFRYIIQKKETKVSIAFIHYSYSISETKKMLKTFLFLNCVNGEYIEKQINYTKEWKL